MAEAENTGRYRNPDEMYFCSDCKREFQFEHDHAPIHCCPWCGAEFGGVSEE